MEQKTHSLIPTFLVTLIFGLVLGILNCFGTYLPWWLYKQEITNIGYYMIITRMVSFVINPVLIFILFYLVRRKIGLKARSFSFFALLIIGAFIGITIGYIIITFILRDGLLPTAFFMGLILQFTAIAFASLVILAFLRH